MKHLWQRFRNWFQWTFGTPPAYDYYHVPVGYQNEPIGEAICGGRLNTSSGSQEAFCPGWYEAFGTGMTTAEWEAKYNNDSNIKGNGSD